MATLIDEAVKRADETIKKHRKQLDDVAQFLIREETMEEDDFLKVVGGPNKKKKYTEPVDIGGNTATGKLAEA